MRILITGVTGFAGGHLAESLGAAPGQDIHGLARGRQWPAEWRHLADRVTLHSADLTECEAVTGVLKQVQPEQIYHLAGYAHVGQSVREPEAAWNGNLTATRRLYEAVTLWGGKPRILYVGSAQIYANPNSSDQPLDENSPLRPATPYAASKVAADYLSYQVTVVPGLAVVRARPFNHTGPRQSPDFAIANFARQIAAVEKGRQPPVIQTGNLDPRRDLTDVRDVAEAYRLLMEKGRVGEAYNIGTGVTWSIGQVLDRLLALSSVKVDVKQDAQLVRTHELPALKADAGKIHRETGWKPQLGLDEMLRDMLAYWRTVG